jgi:isochorismate hydrolase
VEDGASDLEKHPEKRVRAAYLAFEEREMVRLKEEYPSFRLSQLKQMLKKEWQKSPSNPFNQPTRSTFNAK